MKELGRAVPLKVTPPIVKAEQITPGTRADRRQAEREANRKHKIKYAKEVPNE